MIIVAIFRISQPASISARLFYNHALLLNSIINERYMQSGKTENNKKHFSDY
jgi:hypothetical protein